MKKTIKNIIAVSLAVSSLMSVSAMTAYADSTAYTEVMQITAASNSDLEKPENIRTSATSSSVTISWDDVDGAEKYVVYIYDNILERYEKYKSTTKTKIVVDDLDKGTSYKFRICAVDEDGELGEKAVVSVKTKAADLPSVSSSFTGLKKSGNSTYYFKKGKVQTGLQKIKGDYYYFDKNTYAMKKGWVKTNGKKYYFTKDGTMARNVTLKIEGKSYVFDSEGNSKVKSSSSSSSSDNKKTNEGELNFDALIAGSSKSNVIKNCGITNYYTYDNWYVGNVNYNGIKCILSLAFNSRDKLYCYSLTIPSTYSEYSILLEDFKNTFGKDYSYNNGSYIWTLNKVGILVQYKDGETSIMYLDSTYSD